MGKWFYVEKGDYYIFSAIKSTHDNVKHLEGIGIYGDMVIRLRVVIELLKQNMKNGSVILLEKDLYNISFKVLRSENSMKKLSDDDIQNSVNNWLPSMLMIPLYEDISFEKRERATK
jgi:hypothetical protein